MTDIDEIPQSWRVRGSESAANTFTQAIIQTNLPSDKVACIQGGQVKITIGDEADGSGRSVWVYDTTRTSAPNVNEAGTYWSKELIIDLVTSGKTNSELVFDIVISKGPTGLGPIVTGTELYVGVLGTSQTSALDTRWRIDFVLQKANLKELQEAARFR